MDDAAASPKGPRLPSKGVAIVLVVLLSTMLLLVGFSVTRRLRRQRSVRRLIEALRRHLPSTLNGRAAAATASRYPAARPSKLMTRFAGVSVVEGNAVIGAMEYTSLRRHPSALVEVSDCGTASKSADVSETEWGTAVTSAYSRATTYVPTELSSLPDNDADRGHPNSQGQGHHHRQHLRRRRREGRLLSRSTTAISFDGCSANGDGCRAAGPVESTPPRVRVVVEEPVDAPFSGGGGGAGLQLPMKSSKRIISNISVEDLAAHCAAQEADDAGGSRRPQLSVEVSDVPRESMQSPMSPFSYIMQQKAKKARSVVVVSPCPSSPRFDDDAVVEIQSAVTDAAGSSPRRAVHPRRASGEGVHVVAALHRDSSRVNDVVDMRSVGAISRQSRRRLRNSGPKAKRRECRRRHVSNGGFILCKDFVPDLASRRRRKEYGQDPKKTSFAFQLKDDAEYYGEGAYFLAEELELGEERGMANIVV